MSYYRYITGLYKSTWPELNRTLRSSSVPRTVLAADPDRYVRGSSMPPTAYFTDSPPTYVTNSYYSTRRAASATRSATPFRDRETSFPSYMASRYGFSEKWVQLNPFNLPPLDRAWTFGTDSHYSDFDYKVKSYRAELDRQETARNFVSYSRNYASDYSSDSRHQTRLYPRDSFSARYDYYHGNKHSSDSLLYPCSTDVLGNFKHFNRSSETLNARNARARSPLISRELDRYFETTKRTNYVGDFSSGGACDFRYYNYRRVPYFGGSDNYVYMKQKPGSRRM